MNARQVVAWLGRLTLGLIAVLPAAAAEPAVGSAAVAADSPAVKEFRQQAIAVSFPSQGLTLRGWIYKPQGDGPFPAVIWNHGSEREPTAHPALALFYTRHGYVLFLPVRHGHAPSPGEYIGDALDHYKAGVHDPHLVERKLVELQDLYNADVVAAVAWLKTQSYVAADRIAVSGCSYGGIQTLLTAEKGLGVRAFLPFAPAAMSWANRDLEHRLAEAVRHAVAPIFLLQAENDFSLGPSQVLGPLIVAKGGANRARVFPAFGSSHMDGHAAFAVSEAGTGVWGPAVLGFLEEALLTGPTAGALPAVASPPAAPAAALRTMSWTVEGVTRQGLVYLPDGAETSPAPVLFAFHGHGSTMQNASSMNFHRLWPQAIVVYLQGLPTVNRIDQQGRESGWQVRLGQNGDRDLKLFDTVLADLRRKAHVDDQRIFSTGMSNGATFTYLLWAHRGNVLAAVAVCAGRIPEQSPTVARPLLHIAGQVDQLVPLSEQMASIDIAKRVDGVAPTGIACGTGCTQYPSAKGTPVEVIVHPGGHIFPAFASAKIVEFLKQQSLGSLGSPESATASASATASPTAPPTANQAAAAPGQVMTWTVNGERRQGLVFLPAQFGGGKAPVVFAFHGHGGNMQGAARGMAFQTQWPEAIVVYLQGLPTVTLIDPAGKDPGWQLHLGQNGDRDLKLFDAVVAELRAKYPVDDHRIYATGMSNGGFFSYFLWAHRPAVLAAIAPCAARLMPDLHPSIPRPILHIAGETDQLVTLAVQQQTIAAAKAVDGAAASGTSCGAGCTLYPSTKGAPVEVILHPGGHIYPSFATARIVQFLREHPLP